MINEQLKNIDDILKLVQKPARYIGNEYGAVKKDFNTTPIKFAFAFPDLYEIGMSNLGMKILYEIINNRNDALCDRVFMPWTDMADALRENNINLFSIESQAKLSSFDIVGFTLQYEMSYTNIIEMLNLGGIEVFSRDREHGAFVIAGGPCACNPEPLYPFIDAFLVGDGEDAINQILDEYSKWKSSGEARIKFLEGIMRISGVYVPAFYSTDNTGKLFSTNMHAPDIITRAVVKDIDAAEYPIQPVLPYVEAVHDRIMLEVARGCTQGCRFCQAGMIYRPVRERSLETLLKIAQQQIQSTGYEEISLSSLSVGDYSCLPELTRELIKRYSEDQISISLPSLRVDSVIGESLSNMSGMRKSSLTFAPEAGSQRLRDVINKGITREDLIASVTDAFENGYTSVKLYFMIGLPSETYEDLDGIVELVKNVASVYYQVNRGKRSKSLRISVGVSAFIPKPFTPFQWYGQNSISELNDKHNYLRARLKPLRNIEFSWNDSRLSQIEACFARGGRDMADVLFSAWENGCRLDGWSECFEYEKWVEAFNMNSIDIHEYASQTFEYNDMLPWEHINMGITKAFLIKEDQKAKRGETTTDCKNGKAQCHGCGINTIIGACDNSIEATI